MENKTILVGVTGAPSVPAITATRPAGQMSEFWNARTRTWFTRLGPYIIESDHVNDSRPVWRFEPAEFMENNRRATHV